MQPAHQAATPPQAHLGPGPPHPVRTLPQPAHHHQPIAAVLQGCPANIVTFNTLIDVYGKSGQWEEALGGEGHPRRLVLAWRLQGPSSALHVRTFMLLNL